MWHPQASDFSTDFLVDPVQQALRISRRIEYALRAMVFLAAQPGDVVVPFREIARRMDVPQEFLAKILKTLVAQKLVDSTRGARGGYQLRKPAREISFLDVIEAVEGPIVVNVCQEHQGACHASGACTMYGIWKLGQQRMLDVYRNARLDQLAMSELRPNAPVPMQTNAVTA